MDNVPKTTEIKIPKAFQYAINYPEGNLWKYAMDYKLTKLEKMNMWSEIDKADILQDAQILPGMWVHLIKILELGGQKFRSRWVVHGDKQKTNLSLSDTFVPISHITSLQILLALATIKDMRIFASDVDSAYLHGKVDHNMYIEFPNGYGKPGKAGKLSKAFMAYLKQHKFGVRTSKVTRALTSWKQHRSIPE